jgi:hypothetical protein
MNQAGLYLLGQKLTAIAGDALPAGSVLRRVTPGARLVPDDAVRHPGTSVAEIAGRTGLLNGQVSALADELAAAGLLQRPAGPARDRVSVGRSLLLADSAAPVDAALAAALGPAGAGGFVCVQRPHLFVADDRIHDLAKLMFISSDRTRKPARS